MARKRRCRQNGPREKAVLIRVDDDEKRMLQDAARRRGQTVSLTVIEAVKLLEGSLYVEEEEHDSPTVQALRDIEYQLRRIGRNVNQIAHNVNREMNAIILHGIPQSCRAKSLPINEIDMGVASDVNVYTFTRFAPRIE
jgi:predicted transcriptional regulator